MWLTSILARQRFALGALPRPALPRGVFFLDQHRQQGVFAKPVVIVQVFLSQCQPLHPLRYQLPHRVLNPFLLPMVAEAARKLRYDLRSLFHFPQQQPPRVAGDRSALKPAPHFALVQGMKFPEIPEILGYTV